jgi:hypothetical protein
MSQIRSGETCQLLQEATFEAVDNFLQHLPSPRYGFWGFWYYEELLQ